MNTSTICFVAGRSGGHIKPALTLAKEYRIKNPHSIILFFSTAMPLDEAIIKESNDITLHVKLALENIPKKFWQYPMYLLTLGLCIIKSLFYLMKYKPNNVISMGGYISLPVCLAAKLLRIPIELFELNAVPGRATNMLAPLCTTVYGCFSHTKKYFHNYTWHSYPIQFDDSAKVAQKDALKTLQLCPDKKTIVILGGSQGSLFINRVIKKWLEENPTLHNQLQIIHQTGNNDFTNWQQFYESYNIQSYVFAYSKTIEKYYNAADLIICRAGAGTLFEAMFFEKPCLVIPLETKTTNHQLDNALAMAQKYPNLVRVLKQDQIENQPSIFANKIQELL